MSLLVFFAASVVNATPATVDTVIAHAREGTKIVLSAGDYGKISIRGKQWPKPITLDMTKARATLDIDKSKGIRVVGGSFGRVDKGYAINVRDSQNIAFSGAHMTSAPRGLVITQSQDVTVSRAVIERMIVDGINIASSQRVTITDSTCRDFNTGEAHPDCIQMWSSPERGITQDVTLLRNRSEGKMQGFTAFNHVRNGIDDGGFDRITMSDNWVRPYYYVNGIAVYDCRHCVITNNVAEMPASPPPTQRKAVVRAYRCTDCTVEGNIDTDRPRAR